jgi:nucleotide-binding universal stress UspA family protein
MSFQKIIVAIDNSHLCPSVFAQALDLARVYRARLLLLHCITSDMVGEPVVPMSPEIGLYPATLNTAYESTRFTIQQQTDSAQAMLQSYCKTATRYGVSTEFDYKVGDAGDLLCKMATNWGADLIVLGRRGRTGLAEVLLGSVSNHVLHHAPCAVLVIQEAGTSAS